jgi:hypothetical protein
MKCLICGCGDWTPCIDRDGVPCCWVTPDLCSACLRKLPEGKQQVAVEIGEFLYLASMGRQLAEELPEYTPAQDAHAARLYREAVS